MNEIKIHSIETLGALDGPGLRTVIFFSGCPMRCAYCHNPDSWAGGESKSVAELVEFCLRYKNYYGKRGGVTLSGGEPCAQEDGALALTQGLHAGGIHVALDTGGGIYSEKLLDAVDLVILDIKHAYPEEFRSLTGVSMDNLHKILARLSETKKPFWARQVIAPTITDEADEVLAFIEMAKNAEKIELLPYHTMGEQKYEKLGLEYRLKGVQPPSKQKMDELGSLIPLDKR